MVNENELLEYKDDLNQYLEQIKRKDNLSLKQDIQDMTQLLQVNERNLENVQSQNWFQRSWASVTGKNKKLMQMNANNLLTAQKLSLSLIMELEKQNMMTREMQVLLFERLNEVAITNIHLKNYILELVNKLADRFEKIESQMDDESQFNLLIHEINLKMYQDDSELSNLLKIITQLSVTILQNERHLKLLEQALMQQGYLSLVEQPLKSLLKELSLLSSTEAKELRGFFSDKMSHPVTRSVIQTLDYAAIEERKKKFLKFDKVLNEIELEIETSIPLSLQEFYQFMIEDAQEALLHSENELALINHEESVPSVVEETVEEVIKEVIEINYSSDFDSCNHIENKIVKIQSDVSLKKAFTFENCKVEFYNRLTIDFKYIEKVSFINCELNFYEFDDTYINTNIPISLAEVLGNFVDSILDDKGTIKEVKHKNLIFDHCVFEAEDFYWDNEQTCIDLSSNINVQFNNCLFKEMKNVIHYSCRNYMHEYDLHFEHCSFENCKGYIVNNCQVPFRFESSTVAKHRPLISLKIDEDEEIEFLGRFLFNLAGNSELIYLKDSIFNDVSIPILYTQGSDDGKKYIGNMIKEASMKIDSCEFHQCKSTFPMMVFDHGRNHEFRETRFIDCTNIYFDRTGLDVSNCETRFINCNFYRSKAASFAVGSSFSVISCTSLNQRGGAIYVNYGPLFVKGCKFEECSGRIGGAIYAKMYNECVEIIDSQFISCESEKDGSAIRLFGAYEGKGTGRAYLMNVEFEACKSNDSSDALEIYDIDNVMIR